MPRRPRRRRVRRRSRKLAIAAQPVPNRKLVKLRYVDWITLNPTVTADTIVYKEFRANSAFDPDYTGAGHQPLGFDQWMTFYDHFNVVGSKITCTWTPSDVNTHVGVYLDDDTTAVTSLRNVLEQKGATYRSNLSTGDKAITTTKTFSAKKFLGPSMALMDSNTGSASANPSEDAIFKVFAGTFETADPGAMVVQIQIDYIMLLTERKTLAES